MRMTMCHHVVSSKIESEVEAIRILREVSSGDLRTFQLRSGNEKQRGARCVTIHMYTQCPRHLLKISSKFYSEC